jgi:hypothetical protein
MERHNLLCNGDGSNSSKKIRIFVFVRLQSSSEFYPQPILQSKGGIDEVASKFKRLGNFNVERKAEFGIVYTFIGASALKVDHGAKSGV